MKITRNQTNQGKSTKIKANQTNQRKSPGGEGSTRKEEELREASARVLACENPQRGPPPPWRGFQRGLLGIAFETPLERILTISVIWGGCKNIYVCWMCFDPYSNRPLQWLLYQSFTHLKPGRLGPSPGKSCALSVRKFCQKMGPNRQVSEG